MKDTHDIEIQDAGSLKKYRTEIPNIVYDLGLTPYELALYCHYKRAAGAGQNGRCTKGRDTLARETGMSAGMVTKAKEGLMRRRKELGNRPLIHVTEQPKEAGGKPLHIVSITDIWDANFKRYSQVEPMSPHDIAMSYSDRPMSPHDGAMSPHDIKKEPVQERTNIRSTVHVSDETPAAVAESSESTETLKAEPAKRSEAAKRPKSCAPKSDKPKPEPMRADDPLLVAVHDACNITELSTKIPRIHAADAAKAFKSAGVTPEQIRYAVAQWYQHDWRGKRGDPPTPAQLRDNFNSLLNRKDVKANGTHQQRYSTANERKEAATIGHLDAIAEGHRLAAELRARENRR